MSLNQAEEEQVEALKAWWKNYGASVVLGVVLGGSVLGGYKYWTFQYEKKTQQASLLYAQVLTDFKANSRDAVAGNAKKLIDEYSTTPYSAMASLLLAKQEYKAGKVDATITHLQWVVDNSVDPGIEHTARLRLGRILLEKKAYDDALAVIPSSDVPGFESEYLELRGDIFVDKGLTDDARQAYQMAIQKLPPETAGVKAILDIKLANTGIEMP